MLQIVVWMLCVYFVVKGFEIISDPVQRNTYGSIGAIIAFVAAPIFFWLSIEQTRQQPEFPASFGTVADPITATSANDAEDPSAAADRALKEAQEAIENADAALNSN